MPISKLVQNPFKFDIKTSIHYLMRAIKGAHPNTCVTSSMRVKKEHEPLMFITLIVWDNGTKKMKERTKTSNLIVDTFFFNLC